MIVEDVEPILDIYRELELFKEFQSDDISEFNINLKKFLPSYRTE